MFKYISTLEKKRIIHSDLKPENILTAGFEPKVSDLGCAAEISTECKDFEKGTFGYMAPEVFDRAAGQESYNNSRVDVFSAGVVAIWIHSGANPFFKHNSIEVDMDTYRLLKEERYDAFWARAADVPHSKKPTFSDDFKEIV